MCQDRSTSVSQTKAQVRAQVIAARNAIPTPDRTRRSAEVCQRLVAHCASALHPGAFVAAYCAMGSELNLNLFIQTAFTRSCRVCLPCMLRENGVAPTPRNTKSLTTPNGNFQDACGFTSPQKNTRVRMSFLEVSRRIFDMQEAPFITKPAKAISLHEAKQMSLGEVNPHNLDVIVVPLVAFDESGKRLGYGGGNYDQLLENVRDDAIVVGAAFAEQKLENIPIESHDKPLTHIIVG